MAHAAVFLGQAEVDADAFGVANVQVAVGLGGEAGADLGGVGLALALHVGATGHAGPAAAGVGALRDVFFNDLAQEVADLVLAFGGSVGGVGLFLWGALAGVFELMELILGGGGPVFSGAFAGSSGGRDTGLLGCPERRSASAGASGRWRGWLEAASLLRSGGGVCRAQLLLCCCCWASSWASWPMERCGIGVGGRAGVERRLL